MTIKEQLKLRVLLMSLVLALTGCNTTTVVHMLDRHAVYQTAPLAYLQAGNYDNTISVQQFTSIGNFGVGLFDGFDGEAVLADGVVYQATNDGKIVVPPETAKLLFGACMLFDVEKRFTMRNVPSYAEFQKALKAYYATNQMIRAIQVEGSFNTISVACSQRQQPPYKPFSEASRMVQEHTWKNVRGTLIGFWLPPTVPDAVMTSGFHLQFISEDRTKGGRVIDFESDKLILYFKQVMRMTVNYAPASSTHFDVAPR